ncbi:MAG TPA: hypothetical protein VKY85_01265 [Candidatus Angelobacter sp.]|nr:hypothetical protein [Candidatus Angelobacter sp.]
MPAERLIALNAAGGAQVAVLSTIPARYADFMEDESVAPQGLIYQSPEDGFAGTYQVGPATEPLVLANDVARGRGHSPLLGAGQQSSSGAFNFRAADTLLKATSSTQVTTKIRVRERE